MKILFNIAADSAELILSHRLCLCAPVSLLAAQKNDLRR